MATQREIAEFLRLALRLGLINTGVVEHWVDSIIAAESVVRFPFTDLAGASSLRRGAVDELLSQIAGEAREYLPGRAVMALLRRRIQGGEIAPEAAIKLALEAGREGALAETEQYKADALDDSVWLAVNDTYGTLADVRRDIIGFFEQYAEYDEQIPTPA